MGPSARDLGPRPHVRDADKGCGYDLGHMPSLLVAAGLVSLPLGAVPPAIVRDLPEQPGDAAHGLRGIRGQHLGRLGASPRCSGRGAAPCWSWWFFRAWFDIVTTSPSVRPLEEDSLASGVSPSIWSASRPDRDHSRVEGPAHRRCTPELSAIGTLDLVGQPGDLAPESTARAASSLATGIRNGEHET